LETPNKEGVRTIEDARIPFVSPFFHWEEEEEDGRMRAISQERIHTQSDYL